MTQEQKHLLLVDLCARLPYGVQINHQGYIQELTVIVLEDIIYSEHEVKPYLRPMSSMTDEEFKELSEIDRKRIIFSARHLTWHIDGEVIDFFNSKMLDWRGLISMGLALEAPENMYKINTK